MRCRFSPRLLGLIGLTALSISACAPKDPMADVTAALARDVLLPAHQQWLTQDRELLASAQAFCAGEQSLDQARASYLQAHRAWAHLQPLALGPLGEGNLAWQVQFWPDKKNLVARQVNALLKQHPQPTLAQVESASVVVQGLTAYEYLLFDASVNLNDAAGRERYCPLLTAIGEHQQSLAQRVVEQWQAQDGMAAQLAKQPNDRYADASEALGDILRVQITALDGLKKKLGAPLGRPGQGVAQPYQAEAWRSGATLASVAATIEGAERIWQGQAGKGVRSLLGSQHAELARRLDAAYAEVRQQLDALPGPIADQLADPAGRQRLDALYGQLDNLHRLHQSELAAALNIQIGFNAHDGD